LTKRCGEREKAAGSIRLFRRLLSLCLSAFLVQLVSTGYLFSMCPQIPQQVADIERQALATVQQMPVSSLDPELPNTSFANWFSQLVGPKAGVIWQLTECGEFGDRQSASEWDLAACTEANAVLPDGRKVMVAIRIGTFKRGISGKPVFYYAIIEDDDRLRQTRRLRDLPDHLRSPRVSWVDLPEATVKHLLVIQNFNPLNFPLPYVGLHPDLENVEAPEARPLAPIPPPEPLKPLRSEKVPLEKVPESLLRGRAKVKINPDPPANSAAVPVFFRSVKVVILVSEQGQVIEAKAVSGHPTLRGPAVEAARKWVFEPSTLNGQPVKVESVLTFVFGAGAQ
jgi:hypothetical protein